MTGLVLKLSYNKIGENPVGGICGSFFFISPNLAATAHHVLNKKEFKPNDGFSSCQYWLLIQPDIVIELKKQDLIELPEIDSTVVKIREKFNIPIKEIATTIRQAGHPCCNEGFTGGLMPEVEACWGASGLIINGCNYKNTVANGDGHIQSIQTLTVNAADIKMHNVKGLETSYGGKQGMSGGPLIDKETNEIIGLMSIGLPPDVQIKETLFAVEIGHLMDKLRNVIKIN
jgi:hypothetical protein